MPHSFTRRDLMRTGFLSGAGVLFAIRRSRGQIAVSDGTFMSSPPVRPWIEPLTFPPVKEPEDGQFPDVNPYNHQRFTGHWPQKYYQLDQVEVPHTFHPDLPPSPMWTFDGVYPGPTFVERYGAPIQVRIHNDLPVGNPSGGYGYAGTSTHLHNLHSAAESDGFPNNFIHQGEYRDHHYINWKAGFSDPGTTPEDNAREALGTLWYHDHFPNFTAANTYKGLAGFYLLFDGLDTGNETDTSPTALRLPSGAYDVPLFLQDKLFDSDGQLFFDVFNFDGVLGDLTAVNGKIQPYMRVDRRKYRFRILNGGPSRIFDLWLTNGRGAFYPLVQIANDGNLLAAPVTMTHTQVSMAERSDIVINFNGFRAGTELFLVNRAEQVNGRKPTGKLLNPGIPILKFIVNSPTVADPSRVPATLRPLPSIDLSKVVRERTFLFERRQGAWAINGEFYDPDVSRADVQLNTSEIWTFRNNDNGWVHPIHVHNEEFRILSRNGKPPAAHERGRKDVVLLHGPEEIRVLFRFRDFTGKYVMHCHNTVHEDHDMMLRWDVQGETDWG